MRCQERMPRGGACAAQLCLLGETKLWRKSDLKLREDNDELSRRLAMLERGHPAGAPEKAKLVDADDGMFDQARPRPQGSGFRLDVGTLERGHPAVAPLKAPVEGQAGGCG